MISLFNKYRPTKLDEVFGNNEIRISLGKDIKSNNISQAILLTGNSGCGKTTIARIIAKELGCGEYDINELNLSEQRGIDAARSIIEECSFLPMGNNRVWILDECHGSTKDFQNAILKVLEDTPPNNYFILCSTDPGKLLKTIKNRCTKYEVKPLHSREMSSLLVSIARAEHKELPIDMKNNIIQQCEGSPRAAIVMLEQVLGLNKDDANNIIETYKTTEQQVITLCRTLMNRPSWKEVVAIISNLKEEPEGIRWNVLMYLNTCLLKGGSDKIFKLMECFKDNYYDSKKSGLSMSCWKACNL